MNAKKKEYDINYLKTKCTAFKVLLNNEKDEDIILFLRSQNNVNRYIKTLIRSDMMKERKV